MSKPLSEATDHELLQALGVLWGTELTKHMTRSVETEAHHMLLYAIAELTDLRVHMEANWHRGEATDWRRVTERVLEAIRNLNALVIYARSGKGGTSYLADRNQQGGQA